MTTVLDTCYSVSHWQEAPKPETDDNENKNRIENRTQEKRSVVVTLMFTASLTCAVVDCGFLSRGSHYSRTFYVMTVGLQNPITLAASQFHCLWFGRAPESQCEETLTCWTQDSLHFLFFVILRSFFLLRFLALFLVQSLLTPALPGEMNSPYPRKIKTSIGCCDNVIASTLADEVNGS